MYTVKNEIPERDVACSCACMYKALGLQWNWQKHFVPSTTLYDQRNDNEQNNSISSTTFRKRQCVTNYVTLNLEGRFRNHKMRKQSLLHGVWKLLLSAEAFMRRFSHKLHACGRLSKKTRTEIFWARLKTHGKLLPAWWKQDWTMLRCTSRRWLLSNDSNLLKPKKLLQLNNNHFCEVQHSIVQSCFH